MSDATFTHWLTIPLYDTDAAGRLFFGHLFRHAHDAFESFMAMLGLPLDQLIRDGQILLPLIHAEADYHQPLCHGDVVQVQVMVLELRRRSFAMGYRFLNERGERAASARTVHVQVSADGTADVELAASLRAALTACLASQQQTG